ncbi:hypothetical protein [Microbispora sp. NPDC049633]|uniref:hypothetical protein n=1 Tax=Microbispora sp. NPDC049633 TaxID=3154355 RepID=UPI0034362BD9
MITVDAVGQSLVVRRGELTDKAWQRIGALLPATDGRERPWRDQGQSGKSPFRLRRDHRQRAHLVERCFGKLKQWRAVATRFDKLADRYLAGVTLASVMLWLRHFELSDRP